MFDVHEINDLAGLHPLREVWSSLLAQTPRANFFQTLEWLEVYWKHFGHDQRLRVLVVSQSGQVRGIVPLVVRSERTKAGLLKFLTYPLANWGSFYGPVGPDPLGTLQAALAYLRRTRRDWQVLELRFIEGDAAADQTGQAMRDCGFQAYKTVWDRTSVIDLSGTWQEYLAGRTSQWRNNAKRWERKLSQHAAIRYVRHRPGGQAAGDVDPRWDLYDIAEEIARRSWQATSFDGTTLCSPSIRPFLRDMHAVACREGFADLNLLYLDEHPCAYAYNYVYRGSLFGLRVGYNAEAAKHGPGNLLYLKTLQDSFARGDWLYDLGPGSLEAKRYLRTRLVTIYRCSHYHPLNLRAQLVRLKRRSDARALQRVAAEGDPGSRDEMAPAAHEMVGHRPLASS